MAFWGVTYFLMLDTRLREIERMTGRATEIERTTGRAVEIEKMAGKTAEIGKMTGKAAEIGKMTGKAAEIGRMTGRAAEIDGMKTALMAERRVETTKTAEMTRVERKMEEVVMEMSTTRLPWGHTDHPPCLQRWWRQTHLHSHQCLKSSIH